jgi:hypothetical protein
LRYDIFSVRNKEHVVSGSASELNMGLPRNRLLPYFINKATKPNRYKVMRKPSCKADQTYKRKTGVAAPSTTHPKTPN